MTLGSLNIETQGYVPVLLEKLCGIFCSGTCMLLGGASFQCRCGGFWCYRLMFPGFRSSLVFSGFGLKPPASGFSLILTVPSRLLHLYSTNDKTSRLMMKSFSTVRDTRRGTQSYMEKRRGRRELEVTRRRRGGIKRRESKLASNHFPMCSPQSGSLRDVHRVTQRREEGGRRQKWPGG